MFEKIARPAEFTRQAFFLKKMKTKLYSTVKTQIGDLVTPVSMYLKIREKYPVSVLLESSDYQGKENSFSFIAFEPIATYETGEKETKQGTMENIVNFYERYEVVSDNSLAYQFNGIFGYMTFESIQYFDTIEPAYSSPIPNIRFHLFKYVLAFDHFSNQLHIIENSFSKEEPGHIEHINKLVNQMNGARFSFEAGTKESTMTNTQYKNLVTKAKEHCKRGDVFQLVLSRPYSRAFKGDEFNVYRALRSINPSPYLFYFDYGSYKLMGSSPEAQIVVKDNKAEIHPIAGTVKRSGDELEDEKAAKRLTHDPKENAEHVMLVDLARNDLSRTCSNVYVEKGMHLQFFSHVIHLVSIVKGEVSENKSPFEVLAHSFPAGTLSGAPKYRAVELINTYEETARGFYGGAIGYANFQGDLNMAIMIRSLMSMNNKLYYQAGAGIVIDSIEENELQEVENKLKALNKAIEMAETL